MHTKTCEIYECKCCALRFNKLSDMKTHKEKEHNNYLIEIIHSKLDRKNNEIVASNNYLYTDLF